MRLELKDSMRASFLTLTYETVPENDGYQDVSAFLKRYRASIQTKYPSTSIRFLNITEYGSRYGRLHHHMALYHLPISLKIQTLFELWRHGRVSISPLIPKRINYIAAYTTKSLTTSTEPPRLRSSRNPVLGGNGIISLSNAQSKRGNDIHVPTTIGFGRSANGKQNVYPLDRTLRKYWKENLEKLGHNITEKSRAQKILECEHKTILMHLDADRQSALQQIRDAKAIDNEAFERHAKFITPKGVLTPLYGDRVHGHKKKKKT